MDWPDNLIKGLGMDPSNYNRDGLFAALELLPFWSRKFIVLHYRDGWTEEDFKKKYKIDFINAFIKGFDLLSNAYKKYIEYKEPKEVNTGPRRIYEIGLSPKVYSVIRSYWKWVRVVPIDELSHYTWHHLHIMPGMTERRYWEVFCKLQEYGVHMKERIKEELQE